MNRQVFRLEPAGLLDTDSRVMQYKGRAVQKMQPAGCPRNGTMGQCYVQTIEGDFIGLVNQASLVKLPGVYKPVVNKAAEARDRRRIVSGS